MSGGGTNTVQTTIPDWIQPYLSGALGQGQNLLQQPTSSMIAGLQPMQQQGLGSISQTAGGANPSASAANANMFETSGALLNPAMNPYLRNTYNLASDAVNQNIASEFGQAGSNVTNSIPVQQNADASLATQLYGGAYQSGLNSMTQASALAPSIQQGTYIPGQELLQAGGLQQQQQQNVLSAPYNALSWYSGLLGMNGSPFMGQSSRMNNNSTLQDVGLGIGAIGAGAGLVNALEGMGWIGAAAA